MIAFAALAGGIKIHVIDRDLPFQSRNLATAGLTLGILAAVLIWWMLLSRTRWKLRWAGLGLLVGALALVAALFRIRGVSGDLVPILEPRWAEFSAPSSPSPHPASPVAAGPGAPSSTSAGAEFPQFLGPSRNGTVATPVLATNWSRTPPVLVWKQPIGPSWSGFVTRGNRAFTQEQQGADERVTCYELTTGTLRWAHSDPGRYANTIAGEGPRATPTLEGDRIFSLGALGRLNCLDLETGRLIWSRSLTNDASCDVPEWGFSGSPLVRDHLVIVSAGGGNGRSLIAYRADTGEIAWSGGNSGAGYGSPYFATVAGTPQLLIFNQRTFASHDPATGAVLWEVPFGTGYPLVANPIVIGTNGILISAGYNAGAERFTILPGTNAPVSLWKSKKLKAKFSNPILVGDVVYGFDDGILACIDIADGSQRWKEGRYGHGQGLMAGDLFILMSESGDLVLLNPTPDAPRELGRFPVFHSKTWNPIAIRGNQLLVRNDQEAALLTLPLASP